MNCFFKLIKSLGKICPWCCMPVAKEKCIGHMYVPIMLTFRWHWDDRWDCKIASDIIILWVSIQKFQFVRLGLTPKNVCIGLKLEGAGAQWHKMRFHTHPYAHIFFAHPTFIHMQTLMYGTILPSSLPSSCHLHISFSICCYLKLSFAQCSFKLSKRQCRQRKGDSFCLSTFSFILGLP